MPDLFTDYCGIYKLTDAENYQTVWRQTHYDVTDQNNNVLFEDLAVHYTIIRLTTILVIMSSSSKISISSEYNSYTFVYLFCNKIFPWDSVQPKHL
jgi:hypothetical protein